MNKTRVWFNHWFSTAYHIINMMREDNDIYVIGTSRNPDSVVGLACDEWYTEPDRISDDEYAEFCLEFCREHNIDVFVPRRAMGKIAQRAEDFRALGVKLFADCNGELLSILGDKLRTYDYFGEFLPEAVPMHFCVKGGDEFEKAVNEIKSAGYERACFKLAADEGAVTFRVIDDTLGGADGLFRPAGMKVTYETAVKILSQWGYKKPLLVMPYLKGNEVSADCFAASSGNIIIPRYKSDSRIYTVKYDSEIIRMCEAFLSRSGLKMPCNIQFRYHEGVPYLLEVNTRMSGGIQLSCLAAGVNIPSAALAELLGRNIPWSISKEPCKVSYIETPVIAGIGEKVCP